MSQLQPAGCETAAEFAEAERVLPGLAAELPVLATEYVCPGESHPISRSIHLARLASFYSKCRTCLHGDDVGGHSGRGKSGVSREGESSATSLRRETPSSLVQVDGVRGIYLNELDRTRAAAWGAALASLLWDEEPRAGGIVPGGLTDRDASEHTDADMNAAACQTNHSPVAFSNPAAVGRRGPVVVIGFDERPSSPDIVTGVALGLRRMGCQVIDLGQTTVPCFQFCVSHLEAAAGLFVTGAGCDPAWTGFDVVGRAGRPWSQGGRLEELESRARDGVMRPTRTAGSQRTFQSLVPYEAGLGKRFHALRPLHVVCGSSTKLFPRVVERLFSRLPCRVTFATLPVRQRDLCDQRDADVRRVAAAVVAGGQHLGLIVDDDGQRCAFVTERGGIVTPAELARLLIELERREHHHLKVVVTAGLGRELAPWLQRVGVDLTIAPGSAESMAETLSSQQARLGFSGDGRVWFGDSPPLCDALVTLARVLQALSLSDAPFGEVVSRLERA